MKIIISIPAYNEEKTLPPVIAELKKVMKSTQYKSQYKILVLNDGSTDKTALIAKTAGAIVVSNKKNIGLAETFKREMEECLKLDADVIVHTDADGQYPAKYIPKLIEKVILGHDLVIGSRFSGGNYSGSISKKVGNIAFAKTFSKLLNTKITDTTTGFRAFGKNVAKLPLINSFTYTQEQLIRVGKKGLSICEIPITTRKTRASRLFKNPFDYAIKAWINILRIYRDFEPLKFFGKIGLLIMVPGFLIGIYLLMNLIITGHAGYINFSILSILFIIVGLQIVLFGFLADMR
ncbi:glycosyltransferase family 2 protein [Candidatus Woesearchaeota archaeon]|jgi:glycosyltransferase involved in cell wall biosynthesis|nr:glycosyltransferase family 2 protein [Candidatus Woesearchaeota archaeon]MBT7367623.1 glycosyltransferase family 2 protein [Candidatus Woesearchaeota archaeon]